MSEREVLLIGTRGSALALAQAGLVADALREKGVAHEIVVIETAGDVRAPDTSWGEGAFVTAIERALVEGRIDIAVHSAKDVPTEEDPRLEICAYLPRAEPRDALVLAAGQTGSLATLPAGTVVGTDSPRRTGFLRAHRPDLEVRPLHGNVDTRLRRLDEGAVGALVLAAAGLLRLGRADRISELLKPEVVPPAPGQGAIAVQVRADDQPARDLVALIDDVPTRHAVEAEREFLNATGGGCRAPIGAWSRIDEGVLHLHGGFATLDGRGARIESVTGSVDDRLQLAHELARRVVAGRARLPGTRRVLVTRPADDSAQLVARLAEQGISSSVVPTIEIELLDDAGINDVFGLCEVVDWVVVTSANAAHALSRVMGHLEIDTRTTRWAAVGQASARELLKLGVRDVWVPSKADSATLGRELPLPRNARVLWARGDLANDGLSEQLTARGAKVTSVTVYGTRVGPAASRDLLKQALAEGPIDAVILASPSAARGLLEIAANEAIDVLAIRAVCVGERTATAAARAGFTVAAVAATPDASALAEMTAQILITDAQPTLQGMTA